MQLPKKVFLSLLLLEVFVNFSGIAVPFFSNDPALYASISKTMAQQNDFINLYVYGIDWLDKPHFPFWMAAFSFKMFGISEWSYRLPALLFILLGAFYTYRLAKQLYSEGVAQIAVLVLLASQHLLMSDTDVRAEPYLLGLIVGAVYHFYNLFRRFSVADLFLGALFAGCAVMTKGIFALVPIGTAILGDAIFAGQFKQLFRWRWLLAIILTGVVVLPEVYAVYVQFDLHPEKTVFGTHGVSGVKWFLWDSQFSRFINSGPITRPKGDVFYYVHTLLWAFAPWCLVFYFVLVKKIIATARKKRLEEYVTLSAFVPMLLFFSLSKFQLNFYTNILFPFFSILVASFISSVLSNKERKFFTVTQAVYSGGFMLGLIVMNFLLKPRFEWLYFVIMLAVLAALVVIFLKERSVNFKWFLISCIAVVFVNAYLNFRLYPMMAALKGENLAAAYANRFYPGQKLGVFENRRNGFDFYTDQPVQRIDLEQWMKGAGHDRIYYVDDQGYAELVSRAGRVQVLQTFPDFASEGLSGKFINASTRQQSLRRGYLVKAAD